MMQKIALYDPGRRPPNWADVMQAGQYAVLRSDAAENGGTCLVFDSLTEAESYCEAEVERIHGLRCYVYDHQGKAKPPLAAYAYRAGVAGPRRYAAWGWLLIAGSVVCFWIDWQQRGALILPTVIGINMIFAGLRLIYWGSGSSRRRAASSKR